MYLEDIPLPEAIARLENYLKETNLDGVLDTQEIPLNQDALGRTLAKPIWAKLSSPHYHAAAMDGYAVQAVLTEGALPTRPVLLQVNELAVYVDTGDPLPESSDAVIPIEIVEPLDEDGNPAQDIRAPKSIRIRAAVNPWMHVRPMGEDMVASQLVLPAGHVLRPVDLGVIAASGNTSVTVAVQPRVAVIPTGSELVPIGAPLSPGEIIEFNSLVLAAQVQEWGGCATRLPIVPDNLDQIQAAVFKAAKGHDLVLVSAGSSTGAEDFTAQVIETLGEVFVHGVAVRPGHPVILGKVEVADEEDQTQPPRSVPVIGIPGYPVSATLTGEIFVAPLMSRWLGRPSKPPEKVTATLTRKITSPPGDDDYVRVALGRVGERLLAAPLARGAGVISSLARADGLALLPRGSQGKPAGADIEVSLYRSLEEINHTIFATGSHDITLDIMGQFLYQSGRRLAIASVGSIGGLLALKRREAHLAGSHLLDPQTGEYNIADIQKYLPGVAVRVMTLVGRVQGLLLQKGNPKRIRNLADLTKPGVTFINRQRGSGTRVLLDYQLAKQGISSDDIQGYQNQEYTHLTVGAAIASGRVDCGIGIAAVTQSLDLEFIPLFEERYDLIIPQEHARGQLLEPLIALLANQDFKQMVAGLPGYDVSEMGYVVADLS